ncbi:MAG: 16S rRNA (cytosine(1402)-N(4))-methyltransferase RsmH [Rhodospirillales bacterium]
MTSPLKRHTPVMLGQVLEALRPRDDAIYVDATFGAGGYSRAFLEAAKCTVWGIERDPDAVLDCAALEESSGGRLTVLHGRFSDMKRLLNEAGVGRVDGVAFDLGVSSMQLDDAGRGFSFKDDGPLDMRMDRRGMTAAEVVNRMNEKELADIIYQYGEERASRRIARAIAEFRTETEFATTGQLAGLVRRIVKRSKDGIDPATRTFQALRIYVNDELGEIEKGLSAAESLLGTGGRLTVVSFHSLEDRMVKDFLRRRSGQAARPSRHLPETGGNSHPPSFNLLFRGAVKPLAEEITANPRARSARMRAAERTEAPAWPDDQRRAA